VEHESTLHNFSLFAIFLQNIIKIGGNFTKFLQKKTILHSFLRHGVYIKLYSLRSFSVTTMR